MFSPIGNLPPSTYWRRRILVIGAAVLVVLLLVLTVKVLAGGGGTDGQRAAASTASSSPSARTNPPTTAPATAPTTSPATSPATNSGSPSTPASAVAPGVASSTAAPTRCTARDLTLQAAVGQSTYKVGAQPQLSLRVTNTGARPCIQDIADKQVVLRVYNGESRVWGSHDCETQPGTADRTLLVNQPVLVSIPWSARTSQEGCQGARQRVGAGSYTLYAQLAGRSGKAANFVIS